MLELISNRSLVVPRAHQTQEASFQQGSALISIGQLNRVANEINCMLTAQDIGQREFAARMLSNSPALEQGPMYEKLRRTRSSKNGDSRARTVADWFFLAT